MKSFSSLLETTYDLLLGKRRPGEQEGSPAKKAKPEQQQQGTHTGMSNAQLGPQHTNGITEVPAVQNPAGYSFPSNGQAEQQHAHQQAAQQHERTMQRAQQPDQQQQQQHQHQPQQHQHQPQQHQKQQQHQQQLTSTRDLDTARSYANVLQTLTHPHAAAAAPDPRAAAAARRHPVQHMPLPSAVKPPQHRHQTPGWAQQRGPFWQQRQLSDDSTQSPLPYRFSPATGPRPRSRQQAGRYGSLGAPPPHQQQQQRLHVSTGLASEAAAGRHAGEVSRTGRPGAAAVQGTHRGPPAAAAAAAAGGGFEPRGSSLGPRSPSPPLGEVAKQLFGGLDRRGTAAAAAAAGRGRQPAYRPAAAAGAGWGTGARPSPPPQFAAALQETHRHLGGSSTAAAAAAGGVDSGIDELLARQAAEKQAAVDRALARLAEARQLSKHAGQHAQQTIASIDRALPVQSPDYRPNADASGPALAELMAITVQREQARLQEEAARVAAREAAARERSLLGARAAEAGVGLTRLPALHHWVPAPLKSLEQLQQQYEHELAAAAAAAGGEAGGGEDDDDVVIISSDEGDEAGSDQQQYEADESVSDEEEGSEASSEEESEEAQQAAAGIESLGITTWMAPRANWSCTREQMDRYRQATGRPDDATVLASHDRSKLELAGHDLKTMAPGDWLNDECMNMYIALLQDRDTAGRAAGGLRCHFFNTFFINKLYEDAHEYKYANVRRWTGQARLKAAKLSLECVLKCDRVIIPVHQGNHWTAMMVDLASKRLVFFDSLMGQNRTAVAMVKQWVADEAKDKLNEVWDTSSWREEYPQAIPQQNNGVDCGVFALMFCNRMSVRGGGFDFTQQDISVNVRAAIVCDLLDGAISATRWGR